MIELRDYQRDLYNRCVSEFTAGHKRVLVVAPCGAGKTYLFAAMAQRTKGDVLILTHRRELLEQTTALLREHDINARVAMILTEANHLGEHGQPALVITDEAHLSMSDSWQKVLDYYDCPTVGVTATPIRLDGKPLGQTYTSLVQGVSVKWLIEHHRLSPFEYYAPTEVETDTLRVQRGDYVIADLEKLMTGRAIYSDVLRSWETIAKGEKTIAYCVSMKHAAETAEKFREAGYAAVALDSTTPMKQRKQIMQDFRDGKITVLCNVGIISEGVSIDDVTCCLLLRATESHALFWQMAMRSMRYAPGKVAKIIDCVGNYTRNPMLDDDVKWSLLAPPKKPRRMTDEGDFTIRTCPKCFMVFKTAPVCPYCRTEYPLHPREVKFKEDVELKRITAIEAAEAEERRKKARMEVGACRSVADLIKIQKERGYAPGWVFRMAKAKGIKIPRHWG